MYYYKKSIIFEFEHIDKSKYEKIIISKNKIIECKNSEIKQYIKNKLNDEISIDYVEFYVSLYDFEIIKSDKYWETLKNLDRDNLPIYRKNDDLYEFLLWLKENFNNNDYEVFETSKFKKRKDEFESDKKEECLKTLNYKQTNIRFNNFNQLYFHAGCYNDIERYGFLYIRTLYIKIKKKENNNNIFNESNIKIWNKFDSDFESIKNTMFYMFNKMKKGILICIKNNKLSVFLPFSNAYYKNDFYKELYFDDQDKKKLEEYEKNPKPEFKNQLEKTVKYYFDKYKLNSHNVLFDRTKWVANDCFFRYENYEGDKSEAIYKNFFVNLCKERQISDCVFFLNLRDHPMLNKNLNDPYTNLINKKLNNKYIFEKYAPILSPGGSKENADICMCTQDDLSRISQKIYPDDCSNGYLIETKLINWENKKNKAVFRGSATGCHIDDNNIRIKASNISQKYPEYLDAGITSFNRKLKKNLNKPLKVIDLKINKSNFMSIQEKATYKYILNLDGHVSAFRLSHEFSLGSVLLIPKSKYYLWFSYLLIPYEHYIPIDENLDNLIEQIKWCINNDSKCKIISENGIKFYNKYLKKDGIYDYMQYILNKISLQSLKLIKYKENIAIITIYRNIKDNTRLQQKRLFLHWMNNMLSQICNYDIIVVEQTDKYLFNYGKLRNIGFEYLNKYSKKKYLNYIFSDIDTLPDSDLIPYFFKQTNSLNSLAVKGTRYENDYKNLKAPFAGALVSSSKKTFEEINGYPNNFYGWAGEDDNLIIRLFALNKPIYVAKSGKIIDIEEINGVTKNTTIKSNELKDFRNNFVWEVQSLWKNFKNNGLSNLSYNILYTNTFSYNSNNNYHIIVDVEYDKDVKKFPHDYTFTNLKPTGKDYIELRKNTMHKVKQIYF